MANEPERDIEKLLRAGAKLRRDAAGEPRPLPPATRNLLQSEAARLHGDQKAADEGNAKEAEDGSFWTRLLWGPRMKLAWSIAVVGLLALAGSFLLPKQEKQAAFELAKNESTFKNSIRDNTSAPSDDAARAKNEPAQLADKLDRAAKPEGAPQKDLSGKSTLASRQPEPASVAQAERPSTFDLEKKKDTFFTSNQPLASTPPPPATPPPLAPPVTQEKESLGLATPSLSAGERLAETDRKNVSQRFARVDVDELALKATKQLDSQSVLASFRLEETNGLVRIIDNDGSVYASAPAQKVALQSAYTRELSKSSSTESTFGGVTAPAGGNFRARAEAPQSSASPAAVRFFRVAGTNLTLHQQVTFSGRIISDVPAAVTNTLSLGRVQTAGNAGMPPSNVRIEGEVLIGNTNQIQITARPAGN